LPLTLFLSFIRFFQLSAIAGPHCVGADENRVLFSFPKAPKKMITFETMLHAGKKIYQ
jgi:hypothetical protein